MKRRLLCLCLVLCMLWADGIAAPAAAVSRPPGGGQSGAADGQASVFPFDDVDPNSKLYDGIKWAYEQGITNGKTPTKFKPGEYCLRQQILTFIWRYAGEQDAPRIPFDDAPENAYYYKAVCWAYQLGVLEKEIHPHTYGSEICTRKYAVISLWRLVGMPTISSRDGITYDVIAKEQFSDIRKIDEHRDDSSLNLAMAVGWAFEMGITDGKKDNPHLFGPEDYCTRGHIATFLHRFNKAVEEGRIKLVYAA